VKGNQSGLSLESKPQWMVAAGDVMKYKFSIVFCELGNIDGNSNTMEIAYVTEDEDERIFTIREGSTILCEVISLNESATTQIAIDGIKLKSQKNGRILTPLLTVPAILIRKTIYNKTYWEEVVSQDNQLSIEGDLIVKHSNGPEVHFGTESQWRWTIITKTFWKTGWLNYFHYELGSSYGKILLELQKMKIMHLFQDSRDLLFPVSIMVFFYIPISRKRKKIFESFL
jgi:hypothetical protein